MTRIDRHDVDLSAPRGDGITVVDAMNGAVVPVHFGHSADVDVGISYNEAPTAIQKLLNKLQKRPPQGGMMNVLGKDESDNLSKRSYADLSSRLDDLIELAERPIPMVKAAWRRWKKGHIAMPKSDFKEEHERLLNVLKQKDPVMLARERKIQSREMRRELSARLDELIEFQGDPRPRNNLGEFTNQQEGGPDPNAMFKTYRVAPSQPGMSPNKQLLGPGGPSTSQLAGAAMVGGAAGTLGSETIKGAGKGIKSLAKRLGYIK